MSNYKAWPIFAVLFAASLLFLFGAQGQRTMFTRSIGYVNQSGQTISHFRVDAGREAFEFANLPPGGMSSIPLGRWSAYEITVRGSFNDGGSIGPTHYMLPSTTISRKCSIRIRPNGKVELDVR